MIKYSRGGIAHLRKQREKKWYKNTIAGSKRYIFCVDDDDFESLEAKLLCERIEDEKKKLQD